MKLVRLLPALPLLLLACGGAKEDARSPMSDTVSDGAPRSIEEAQDQIAEAQQQLGGGSVKTEDVAPAPPPPPPPKASSTDDGKAAAESSAGVAAPSKAMPEAPVDACASPCKAFASMRRAVDALCRMTGETDERCVKARQTLDASNGRVSACRCH